jgi:hypothetical protein
MFIYVITNSATGKVYIGQHKGSNLKKYLQDKLSHSRHNTGSSHLFNSMRKHPKEVWSIAPLMEFETKAEIDVWETRLIALYDTRNPEIGYNICHGGEGYTGPFTAEMKAAWCEGNKRYWSKRKQSLVGQSFNQLTVLSEADSRIDKRAWKSKRAWNCICTCGTTTVVSTDKLKSNGIQSCGCLGNGAQNVRRWSKMDLTGQTFGKLTVKAEAPHYRTQRQWNCKCVCGKRTIVRTGSLRSGNTRSCGTCQP